MIYLMRHGQIEQFSKKRFIGRTDICLSDTGKTQARYWQTKFSGLEFENIYCSDLSRTHQTAQIIAENQKTSVRAVSELREINLGDWETKTMSEIRQNFPDEWKKRGNNLAAYRPANGESFGDLQARTVSFFEKIVEKTSGKILIVAHAGVNRVILCHILGMPLENLFRLGQDYACLNKIKKNPRQIIAMNYPATSTVI